MTDNEQKYSVLDALQVAWGLIMIILMAMSFIIATETVLNYNKSPYNDTLVNMIKSTALFIFSLNELKLTVNKIKKVRPKVTEMSKLAGTVVLIGGFMIIVLVNIMLLWLRTDIKELLITDLYIMASTVSSMEYAYKYMMVKSEL